MIRSLFARKPIEALLAEGENPNGLKRVLGAGDLIMLAIGAVIGAGIFGSIGSAAAGQVDAAGNVIRVGAGPALVVSFLLLGVCCGLAGLCYAELASMIPQAGSAYAYSYATLGEMIAWIIGWDLILEYLFGASTVAVGWSGYFSAFMDQIGLHLPTSFSSAPYYYADANEFDPVTKVLIHPAGFSHTGAVLNLPAMVLIAAMTTLLVIGIKESARFNNFIVILKITIVLLVIGFGFMYVNQANWHPFIPPNTGEYGHYGWSGIVRGAAVVFFAYIGFDAVSTAAQEAKNPQRDLPIGMMASLAICTVLYIAVAGVLTGMVHWQQINIEAPVARAFLDRGLINASRIITLGALAGLTSVMLVMLLGQTRVLYSMANDGLLPKKFFAAIHPKYRTPWKNTILVGLVAAVVGSLTPIDDIGRMVNIGTLLAFVIVSIAVLVLRRTHPDLHRPFRTPWVPLVPILGVISNGYMMYKLGWVNWARLIIWLVIGLVIYFTYSRYHSRISNAQQ